MLVADSNGGSFVGINATAGDDSEADVVCATRVLTFDYNGLSIFEVGQCAFLSFSGGWHFANKKWYFGDIFVSERSGWNVQQYMSVCVCVCVCVSVCMLLDFPVPKGLCMGILGMFKLFSPFSHGRVASSSVYYNDIELHSAAQRLGAVRCLQDHTQPGLN